MPLVRGRDSRLGLVVLFLLGAGTEQLAAQQGRLRGIVTSRDGAPIGDATVSIVALGLHTRTDAVGRFTFRSLPRGELEIVVRRLGYEARTARVIVTAVGTDLVRLSLVELPASLPAVETSERERRRREGIEGFHERRARGLGAYVSREDIEARGASLPSDVLRTTPGIRFVRTGGRIGIRFVSGAIVRRDCAPMIWLDGQRTPGLEIDDVLATDIEGIELYSGPSTTPMQFSQGSSTSTCGTIVVWTREPGRVR